MSTQFLPLLDASTSEKMNGETKKKKEASFENDVHHLCSVRGDSVKKTRNRVDEAVQCCWESETISVDCCSLLLLL